MASRTFEVTYSTNVPQKIGELLRLTPVKKDLIEPAAKAGKKEADEKSKGRYGRKGLGRRTHIRFEQDGMLARVAVDSQISGIAWAMEEGRRPGRRPPYRPIKAWKEATPITMTVRELQESIKVHGTQGLHYMRDAAQVADDTLRGRVAPTERALEHQWNR